MEKNSRIAIIVVFYNPCKSDLDYWSKIEDYIYCVIVDNSDNMAHDYNSSDKFVYIFNGKNIGIALAQNIGIKKVLENTNVEYIVFLDQDSRLGNNYVNRIVTEFKKIDNGNLAILGPTVLHRENDEEYKSTVHRFVVDNKGFSQRQHIISSGSCISVKALKNIGLMNADMFIDYVDFEWCWRAISKGYKCGITKQVNISHKVGQRDLSLWKYKIIISAPFRYYYQYRNFVWLIGKKYVPLQWKIATGLKLSLRLIYFPLFVKGGLVCWFNMIKGIKEGIWERK